MTTTMADHEVTLPTLGLLSVAWLGALAVGAAWAIVMLVAGRGTDAALVGPAAAGVVGVAATAALVVLRPWHPRALRTWPMLWVGGAFLRLVLTIGGAYLLYSATRFGTTALWFAVIAAYVAVLVGETRVYASSMRRFAPGRANPSTPE